MLIVAPFAAMLIQPWVSRTREYEADATGAHLTGNPYALARVPETISTYSRRIPLLTSPRSAHLFIVQPLLSGQTFRQPRFDRSANREADRALRLLVD